MNVVVIQFMLPNGEARERQVDVADDLREQYESLRKCGCRLTAEVLTTGEVSQCIEHEEGDYAIEICVKKDAVVFLEKMIRAFDKPGLEKWLTELVE